MARGVHADEYIQPWEPGEEGLATWVLAHGEPQLVRDELRRPADPPVRLDGGRRGQPDLRAAPGPGGRPRRRVARAPGDRGALRRGRLRARPAVRRAGSIAIRNAEAYRAMEIEAQTDDLTGLLNQGTFAEWLARSVETQERFGLLMLDLDAFKTVNDRLGHQAGDELLRSVAAGDPRRVPAATPTGSSATAATSSPSSVRRRTRRGRTPSPSGSGPAFARSPSTGGAARRVPCRPRSAWPPIPSSGRAPTRCSWRPTAPASLPSAAAVTRSRPPRRASRSPAS